MRSKDSGTMKKYELYFFRSFGTFNFSRNVKILFGSSPVFAKIIPRYVEVL